MNYKIVTHSKKLLSDTLTPVNIYLKLRDVFAGSILLESSDYHGQENSLSMICCEPIASFKVRKNAVEFRFPDGNVTQKQLSDSNFIHELDTFRAAFKTDNNPGKNGFSGCGLFGYMAYDAVKFFEDVKIDDSADDIPEVYYALYRYVIVVNHFTNELTLFENGVEGTNERGIGRVEQLIFSNRFSTYSFQPAGDETSNVTDTEYVEMVKKGISHCQRGDVFQIVLSRRFTSRFKGDEFNVYRALRSINPSPYLFYFDYGSFKLFGSSPEAQLQVRGSQASIFPIAGTFRRTGNDQEDAELANKLAADEKENAEHIMLVDLARNDMSRHAEHVNVEVFKEIQYYSHVIHLVSKVTGKLAPGTSAVKIASDTFPAGTLSGAPKHMAMTLINQIENTNRSFYGGAIGYLGFNNDFNHAIMIRTFLSKNNQLICQAGAGVVSKSNPESELQEVNNKLGALRKAILMAQTI
ncbi:MAG: anthranilate synthase component I family protein [Cyclobacteriaceae bacterium]|nr:anthranilate synthase component I family protein [Cyclobacteriaceae bacterium]